MAQNANMVEQFLHALQSIQCGRWVVALSGGVDSTVLLHLCAQYFHQQTIAVHINHGLSPNAKAWAEHCERLCHQLNIDFVARRVDARCASGQSPEDAAREARYQALLEFIDQDSCLLTAHNSDDQTETVLLQMLRGAGPKGLSAMPHVTQFGQGLHARPLLAISRDEIVEYIKQCDLPWVNDESNTNDKFDRNYIRQQIMPLIKQRWPRVNTTVGRVAQHCAQATQLLQAVAFEDLRLVKGKYNNSLSKIALKKLDDLRLRQVIRLWLHQHDVLMPSTAQLEQIIQQFVCSSHDAQPLFAWSDIELRRYQEDIFLLKPTLKFDSDLEWVWRTDLPLELPAQLGTLHRSDLAHTNVPSLVTVRFRRGGERGKVVGREHTHTLKNLFQEWGVPPWLRSRIPLIYDGERLMEVVGYAVFE